MERHTLGAKRYGSVNTGSGRRNDMPAVKPYTYRGDETGMPEAEVQARIAAARALLAKAGKAAAK